MNEDLGYFDSLDCIDLVIDQPGDRTVVPIPPERRAQAMAERDKIALWEKIRKESGGNGEPKP